VSTWSSAPSVDDDEPSLEDDGDGDEEDDGAVDPSSSPAPEQATQVVASRDTARATVVVRLMP
jgi:hypothetical protein